tara:strand:+ start:275 stop:571 length:297 start_codon:yes stop_codon:yes gene_type:complete
MPPEVRIIGHIYRLNLCKDLGDDELGRCETSRQVIHLNIRQGADSLRDTCLHEILHAVHYLTGCDDDDIEERFTSMGATGLRLVLMENPELTAWILSR